jgi:hypothetical protein
MRIMSKSLLPVMLVAIASCNVQRPISFHKQDVTYKNKTFYPAGPRETITIAEGEKITLLFSSARVKMASDTSRK